MSPLGTKRRRPSKLWISLTVIAGIMALAWTIRSITATDPHLVRVIDLPASVHVAAISPDTSVTVTSKEFDPGSGLTAIEFWRTTDGSPLGQSASIPVYSVAFSPDGKLLAVSCNE